MTGIWISLMDLIKLIATIYVIWCVMITFIFIVLYVIDIKKHRASKIKITDTIYNRLNEDDLDSYD